MGRDDLKHNDSALKAGFWGFNRLQDFNQEGGKVMGKYLYLWEIDRTKIPLDPKERGVGFSMLLEMVKQDMKKGITKEWGVFPGEFNGYSIVEGTEVEIMNQIQQYTPFVFFKVHPIASVTQAEEMIKALTK